MPRVILRENTESSFHDQDHQRRHPEARPRHCQRSHRPCHGRCDGGAQAPQEQQQHPAAGRVSTLPPLVTL
jgi:hypothetical protein